MLTSNARVLISRLMVMGALITGTILQADGQVLADYVPQGGDPPPGNTSTSGMSLL
ncbi:MAG: hypothetical protein AAF827_10215 [Cyanobacteria bacterium P01_D01_bin.6]